MYWKYQDDGIMEDVLVVLPNGGQVNRNQKKQLQFSAYPSICYHWS